MGNVTVNYDGRTERYSPGVNLYLGSLYLTKRVWNTKGRKRKVLPGIKGERGGRGEGRTRRGNVLNGTLQGVLILLGNITLVTRTLSLVELYSHLCSTSLVIRGEEWTRSVLLPHN